MTGVKELAIAAVVLALGPGAVHAGAQTPNTYVGCKVTVEASHGGLRVRSSGLLTTWQNHDPNYEVAELDGKMWERGTGKSIIETSSPPLTFSNISCP